MNIKNIVGMKFPDEYVIKFFFKEKLNHNPGAVLELGAGNGNNLSLFYEYGWNVQGVDISESAIRDANENFSKSMESLGASYRFDVTDISKNLPDITNNFNVLLLPNIVNYISRSNLCHLFKQLKQHRASASHIFLRFRALSDYRYGRGQEVEKNGFKLTTGETGEEGTLNVFYHEHEMIDLLCEHYDFNRSDLSIMRVEFQNIQNDRLITNSDIVIWGRESSYRR